MPSRRAFLASTAAVGLAVTAGCLGGASTAYRSYGYGPRNRGTAATTGPTAGVEPAWRAPEAVGQQVPAVVDGLVVAAVPRADGSLVRAYDAESGEQVWEYDPEATVAGFRPAVADGTLYFLDTGPTAETGTGSHAHAVDVDDGSEVWTRSLPRRQSQRNSPVVADGALVFGLGNIDLFEFGGLYALETADGSTRWHRAPREGDPNNTPAYPAVADGTVYAGTIEGRVAAVSLSDGTTEWATRPDETAGYTGVAVTDDRLYVGGPVQQAALDRGDDARGPAWTLDTGALFSPPAVTDDALYVVDTGTGGVGVKRFGTDGSDGWKHTSDLLATPSPPTVADGTVYYGGRDGRLYALAADTGAERWVFPRDGQPSFWTPAVVDGTVYATSAQGLYALRAP